jgi:hypothetical protein
MKNNETKAFPKSAQHAKVAQALGTLVLLVAIAVTVAALLGVSWRAILTVTIVSAVLFGLGVLNVLSETVRRGQYIEKAFAAYFAFSGWMFLAFGPATGLLWLNHLILEKLALSFQVVVFVIWGALLAGAIWLVATERKRESLFTWLQDKVGRFTPLVYSFNLLMIAMVFFSSVTYVFSAHGKLRFIGPPGSKVSFESLEDFYMWHFLEAIPLLKVNETLGWKPPVSYDSGLVGVVLLLFKLAVILPVIACFAFYWKNYDGIREPTAASGKAVAGSS